MGKTHKGTEDLLNALGEEAAPPSVGRQSPDPAVVERIEQRPTDRLRKFDHNARTHSGAQVNQITASIREFGFVNPVLIGPDDTIIAGHARVLAARRLDMSTIPVIVLRHLSEAQRRALVIADNQLASMAGWDEDMLRAKLAALKEETVDLKLLGFDHGELARLLLADSLQAERLEPDAAPAVPQTPVTAPGDLWVLGDPRPLAPNKALHLIADTFATHNYHKCGDGGQPSACCRLRHSPETSTDGLPRSDDAIRKLSFLPTFLSGRFFRHRLNVDDGVPIENAYVRGPRQRNESWDNSRVHNTIPWQAKTTGE